jgi:hypothetical protein
MVDAINAEEIVRNIATPFEESVNFFLAQVACYNVSSKTLPRARRPYFNHPTKASAAKNATPNTENVIPTTSVPDAGTVEKASIGTVLFTGNTSPTSMKLITNGSSVLNLHPAGLLSHCKKIYSGSSVPPTQPPQRDR